MALVELRDDEMELGAETILVGRDLPLHITAQSFCGWEEGSFFRVLLMLVDPDK